MKGFRDGSALLYAQLMFPLAPAEGTKHSENLLGPAAYLNP